VPTLARHFRQMLGVTPGQEDRPICHYLLCAARRALRHDDRAMVCIRLTSRSRGARRVVVVGATNDIVADGRGLRAIEMAAPQST
jgi:hypothetical protein